MFDLREYQDSLRTLPDDELLALYRDVQKLQPEARTALEQALNRRDLLDTALQDQQADEILVDLAEELSDRREHDRAAIYAQINRRNEVSIDLEDAHRLTFEHLLEEAQIHFHVEDVNFDIAFDVRHRVRYFFRDQDWAQAQAIFREVQEDPSPTQTGKSTFIYYFIAFAVFITLVMIIIALT